MTRTDGTTSGLASKNSTWVSAPHTIELCRRSLDKTIKQVAAQISNYYWSASMTSTLRRFLLIFICAACLVAPSASRGAELREETLKNWDAYVRAANLQMGLRLQGTFLWVDEAPDRLQRVRGGEILASSIDQQNPRPVASGLSHDWIGAAFIPNTKPEEVLAAVRDYGDYKEFYKPAVFDSRLLGTDRACDKYSMRVVNKETVAGTALDMEYETCYFQINERQWYSVTHTTRVQEIRHYGQPGEQILPLDQGSGYVWRLHSITRFEARDGGTYIEVEAIALSRDIPVALRWVVNPIVRRVSRNSMVVSLQQTRAAVHSIEAENGGKAKEPIVFADLRRGAAVSQIGIANGLASRRKPKLPDEAPAKTTQQMTNGIP
jgi:hypothetical protein